MKNIETILKEAGLEVTAEQLAAIDKEVKENYKTVTDYDKQKDKLTAAEDKVKTLTESLDKFKDTSQQGGEQQPPKKQSEGCFFRTRPALLKGHLRPDHEGEEAVHDKVYPLVGQGDILGHLDLREGKDGQKDDGQRGKQAEKISFEKICYHKGFLNYKFVAKVQIKL